MAGVSIATVSRVVNGSSKVSEKTRQRVLSVMEEAEYTPNVFARGLGLDSMKTVGIMCPDISDAYMAKAVSFLEKRLHHRGYHCILSCSGYEQKEREEYTRLLLSKRVDTLVMVGSTYAGSGRNAEETDYIRAAAEKTPVFMVNGVVEGRNIYCICADDFQAVYDLTSSLIRKGKKRILFLCDSQSFSARKKLEGYEKALTDAGYPVINELKFYVRNDIHYAKEMLLAYKLEFDSVVATDDGLGVAALKYAAARGMAVPGELSVAGYNDSELAVCCEPELTSVDSKLEVQCSLTVERMLALLEQGTEPEPFMRVPCEIIRRRTTDF